MSLYTNYISEIENRKKEGLKPKPIEDGTLLKEIILQIKDENNIHRTDSLNFLIYNTIPGTTTAAVVKSKFLKGRIKIFYNHFFIFYNSKPSS